MESRNRHPMKPESGAGFRAIAHQIIALESESALETGMVGVAFVQGSVQSFAMQVPAVSGMTSLAQGVQPFTVADRGQQLR